ncbi:MAG: NAD-dependent epimerase/dehydratase family protein [Pirellulaceae bacterium]
MRTLVTGARGFVGSQLVRTLVDREAQVVCLDRTPATHDAVSGLGITRVTGDLRDAAAISRAMHDVETVFHLAAATAPRTLRESRAVNVEGTRTLARSAAEQTRPPVFVYVSSLAAAGSSATMLDESSPCHPVSCYGRAKWEAEQMLTRFADRLPVTIVRPPCVFGRGDRNLLQLCRMVRRGWEFHTNPSYRYSFLHVDDLVEGLIAASRVGSRLPPIANAERTGTYFLADPTPVTFPELSELIARCLRRDGVRHVRVPYAMAWMVAALGETAQFITRRKLYLNRDKVREAYAGSWMCDPARAMREWGFAPAVSLAERLAETHRSFEADGWL